jgi:RimJ/RimL family protein N-acetyltransferase
MSEYWLTTGRLALRRFTGDDLDWLASVYADADVTQYLGGTKDRTQTQEMLEIRILDYYSELPRRHALCAGEAAIRF